MQEIHQVVGTWDGVRVIAMDSITHANPEFGFQDVLIGASFCGIVAVQFAARFSPHGVIAHDCGVGLDGAGINGLWFLEGRGIPAAAVSSQSARIADGVHTWEHGVISRANHWATALGVVPGDSVRVAAQKMCAWDGQPWSDNEPRIAREVVFTREEGSVVVADSIRFALPEDSGNVVCVGSHGGETAAAYTLEISPKGIITSDGGVGFDDSGVSGLRLLQEANIPAACVDIATARIGDGFSTYHDGVISVSNETAKAMGVRVGQSAREAAEIMLAGGIRG
jgi:hypothetical protein